jgi:hypothetical protein
MAQEEGHMTTRSDRASHFATWTVVGAALAFAGCSNDPKEPDDESLSETTSNLDEGVITPISRLPFVSSDSNTRVLAERLPRPTAAGETTAVHVHLPPPQNPQLRDSLVRVIGQPDKPQVLFRSDALAQLGVIGKSPGRDFFTAFSTLPPEQLEQVRRQQEEIASGAFGEVTQESLVFAGRTPVARTVNPRIDPAAFVPGSLIPVAGCPVTPVDSFTNWGKSLFITSPAIIRDGTRTWDPCTGAGTMGGKWTFAHLIREMAIGSGTTPENFVLQWLSNWLNPYVPNGDFVPARTQMFNQVIRPWAIASGGTATLTLVGGKFVVNLTKPLNLNIAPFRLLSIVNRIDLGETAKGGGGYGGPTTDVPVTAGELRFIFGVVQPSPWGLGGTEATCGKKRFTVIFEYGVPRKGCFAVVDWAKQWAALQAMPGFTLAYKAQLEAMTQSVVVHGAAPTKGNKNAINQIRTNEIALASPWELREFTLTAEDPATNTDPPANGLLRTHTVAQTPNDSAFDHSGPDPDINDFVQNEVIPKVSFCTAGVPDAKFSRIAAAYEVPYFFNGVSFRGGNALVAPPATDPGHWEADSVTAADPFFRDKCGRHVFSLTTCSGCHKDDTLTPFTHVDPLSPIPVPMSGFLTGGGPGFTFGVADTQGLPPGPVGAPIQWQFADLSRRLQRLFDIAFCTSCFFVRPLRPDLLELLEVVPIDFIDPGDPPPFRVGPITDLATVRKVLDLRTQFVGEVEDVTGDVIRSVDASPH